MGSRRCGGKSPPTRPCLLERTALARQPNWLEPDPGHAFVAHAQLVRRDPGQINDPPPTEWAPIVDPHDEGLPGFDGHLHERAERQATVRGYQILRRGVVS
jgi:hypothetical protein